MVNLLTPRAGWVVAILEDTKIREEISEQLDLGTRSLDLQLISIIIGQYEIYPPQTKLCPSHDPERFMFPQNTLKGYQCIIKHPQLSFIDQICHP